MIIRVSDGENVAFVDNFGQVNGQVRIQGDAPLVSHLNHILNLDVNLPFGALRSMFDEEMLYEQEGKHPELYKASDKYIKNHFMAVECPMLGYAAEVLKE